MQRTMGACTRVLLPNSGHTALLERNVNLAALMQRHRVLHPHLGRQLGSNGGRGRGQLSGVGGEEEEEKGGKGVEEEQGEERGMQHEAGEGEDSHEGDSQMLQPVMGADLGIGEGDGGASGRGSEESVEGEQGGGAGEQDGQLSEQAEEQVLYFHHSNDLQP